MAKSAVEALLEGASSPAPEVTASAPDLPPLPKTKGEVGKLSSEQMDALVEAHQFALPGEWGDASAKERHAILNVILGFAKPKKGSSVQVQITKDEPTEAEDLATLMAGAGVHPVPVTSDDAPAQPPTEQAKFEAALFTPDPNDPLVKAAQEIENLPDQSAIESALASRLTTTGMDRFYLGGLLIRLLSVGTFPDNTHFKDYIEQRWGLKYRSARNYITLYSDLLKSGVPWETVNSLGWSKVQILLPVLTPENAAEWVEKAKAYNNETLEQAVKQMQASDGPAASPQEDALQSSKMKTLTFPAAPDQEEIIMEAVQDAMKKANTEHKGVALELICTEYLGTTTPGLKAKQPVAAPQPVYDPKALFQHILAKHGGDRGAAINEIFEPFDDVFQNVTVGLKIGAL